MYQPPPYGRPPFHACAGPPGYAVPPPGPRPPMGWGPPGPARLSGPGPFWRHNTPPPGPGMRMPWSQGGSPLGPGPCGGPPCYGPPPGHPPPHGFPMSHIPPPDIPGSGHQFHGGMKRKHTGNNSQKKKKSLMEKRELPENNAFFCDTCDRGFKTEDKYQEHVQGHEQCSVEGCPFVAAPKLVALHYNLQHRSGLAKQIWKLESKEDVDNWIASRKRNYPTAINMARKQADLKARQDRGEVLDTKQFGKMRGGRGRGRGRGRGWQGHRDGRQKGGSVAMEEDVVVVETDKGHIEQSPKEVLKKADTIHMEARLPCADGKDSAPVEPPCNGLGSIVACYGSDSDDNTTSAVRQVGVESNNNQVSGTAAIKMSKKRKRGPKQQQHKQHKKTQTLLEKLLAGDIRHERNVILQCVRYITKHNFFKETRENSIAENISSARQLTA